MFFSFKKPSHFSLVTNGKTAVNEVEEGGLRASFNFFFKRAILATARGIFFYRRTPSSPQPPSRETNKKGTISKNESCSLNISFPLLFRGYPLQYLLSINLTQEAIMTNKSLEIN